MNSFKLLLLVFSFWFSCSKPKEETTPQPSRPAQKVETVAQRSSQNNKSLPIILRRVESFTAEIAQYESQLGRQSLEPLFQKGESIASALESVIDIFKEDYYLFAKNNMRGYLINRDKAVYVLPDIKFFKTLAAKRGEKADAAFFELLSQTRPDNLWPVYVEPSEEMTGCIRYGPGTMVELYEKWMRFKSDYPTVYVKQRDDNLRSIGLDLATSVCACGSVDEVLKEFRLFIAKFPNSAITPQLKKRINDVLQKTDPMRFNCTTG